MMGKAEAFDYIWSKLREQAKKDLRVDFDDHEFDGVDSYAGGNVDDAYQLGLEDGATDFASTIVNHVTTGGGRMDDQLPGQQLLPYGGDHGRS